MPVIDDTEEMNILSVDGRHTIEHINRWRSMQSDVDNRLFELYVIRETAAAEIASEVGFRPDAIYQRISRLKKSLRHYLSNIAE